MSEPKKEVITFEIFGQVFTTEPIDPQIHGHDSLVKMDIYTWAGESFVLIEVTEKVKE